MCNLLSHSDNFAIMEKNVKQISIISWDIKWHCGHIWCVNTTAVSLPPGFQIYCIDVGTTAIQLASRFIAFGLAPSLLAASDTKHLQPCIVQGGHPWNNTYVLPMCITDPTANIKLFVVRNSSAVVAAHEISFTMVLLHTMASSNMATYIMATNLANRSTKRTPNSTHTTSVQEMDGNCYVNGTAHRTACGTFELYFNGRMPTHINLKHLSVEAPNANNVQHSCSSHQEKNGITVRSVIMETDTLCEECRLTLHVCGQTKPDTLNVQFTMNRAHTPLLSFLHNPGTFIGPRGSTLVPIYAYDDLTLNQDTYNVNMEVKGLYALSAEDTVHRAIFIVGISHDDRWITVPQLWHPMSLATIQIAGTGNCQVTISQHTLVAVGLTLRYTQHAATMNNETHAVYIDENLGALIWGSVEITDVFKWPYHVSQITASKVESMDCC
uniref:Uncharacterized protein n=1 Tax=Otarine gammaherpesvirus 4 TaxID=2801541 RepID=A0A889IY67_9GAMA|nr:hypothetical protein [Otarine gammaherpesvirus 4]